MDTGTRLALGATAAALGLTGLAAPLGAEGPYAGLGARVASFERARAAGTQLRYRVTYVRDGRVAAYEVTAQPPLRGRKLFGLMLGAALPRDVHLVKPYDGYCGIYESRVLGRVLYGRYAVLYAAPAETTATATVSTAAACRG